METGKPSWACPPNVGSHTQDPLGTHCDTAPQVWARASLRESQVSCQGSSQETLPDLPYPAIEHNAARSIPGLWCVQEHRTRNTGTAEAPVSSQQHFSRGHCVPAAHLGTETIKNTLPTFPNTPISKQQSPFQWVKSEKVCFVLCFVVVVVSPKEKLSIVMSHILVNNVPWILWWSHL